jgi:hypothetical protein
MQYAIPVVAIAALVIGVMAALVLAGAVTLFTEAFTVARAERGESVVRSR